MLTVEQAASIWSLIRDLPGSDSEVVDHLNATPSASEFLITDRSLAANPAIGLAGAGGIMATLKGLAESASQGGTPEEKAQAESVRIIINRLTSDGIDLADPVSIATIESLAQRLPETAVARFAPIIKAMIPTLAGSVVGRLVTVADLVAARGVASARARYEETITSANETLTQEIESALSPVS